MSLRIEQKAEAVGRWRWDWSVWLEGTERELDKVESVTYFLHNTFPKPKQVRRNRSQNFRLDSGGHGEFTIKVRVIYKGGGGEWLKHELRLEEPAPDKDRAVTLLKVFLSASRADWRIVEAVRKALKEKNVELFTTGDSLKPGEAWFEDADSAIRASDATIGVFSDATTLWVMDELALAKKHKIPVIPLVVEGGRVPSELKGEEKIEVKHPEDASDAASHILQLLQSKTGLRSSKASLKKGGVLTKALGKLEV